MYLRHEAPCPEKAAVSNAVLISPNHRTWLFWCHSAYTFERPSRYSDF